jgi:hypothetical protein
MIIAGDSIGYGDEKDRKRVQIAGFLEGHGQGMFPACRRTGIRLRSK